MRPHKIATWLAAVALGATACATSATTNDAQTFEQTSAQDTTPDTVANPGGINVTGSTTAPTDTVTTEAPPSAFDPETPPAEPPPFEEVTITTKDEEPIDLYAKYWAGGSTAVLYTHHFQNSATGPQNSDTIGPWPWLMATEGYTVLAPDFRGHGQSEGTNNVNASKADIKAAYEFLKAEGYERIISFAVWGSGPVVVNMAAEDEAIDFDGIALLFPSLARNGNDLITDLPNVDEPLWIVHIDVGSTGGIPTRLEPHVANLYEAFLFPRVPSGLQFIDVYGPEYGGRQLAFLAHVEQNG